MESNHPTMSDTEATSLAAVPSSRPDPHAQAAQIEAWSSLNRFSLDAPSHVEANDHNDTFSFWYRIWLETRREVDAQWTASPRGATTLNELLPPSPRDEPVVACHAP